MKKDTKLIQGIKKGNKVAEKQLYEKYKKDLEKYLTIKYPNNNDQEDDISEILIKIFENVDQYDKKRGKVITWIHNVAKNHMIDKSRKLLNNPIQASYDTTMDGMCLYSKCSSYNPTITNIGTSVQPDQSFEDRDTLSFISTRIGIKDFHLLSMKFGEGYEYKEMEDEMKVSSSTLSNRVNYVRSKLKKGGK